MIASLMMYQRAELDGAHDRLWGLIRSGLRGRGIDAPEALSRDIDEAAAWDDPSLVLGQTCGMPYRLGLHERVELVGTPDYGLDGCAAGYYRSAYVVRHDDERSKIDEYKDGRFAYNHEHSQSGYAAAYQHLNMLGFWFTKIIQCGRHIDSARAVAEKKADIASLDAVSWRLMNKYDSFTNKLRVLEYTTPATPGLPLITALRGKSGVIFDAVKDAIHNLKKDDRALLGIRGIVQIPKADYLEVPNPPIISG